MAEFVSRHAKHVCGRLPEEASRRGYEVGGSPGRTDISENDGNGGALLRVRVPFYGYSYSVCPALSIDRRPFQATPLFPLSV